MRFNKRGFGDSIFKNKFIKKMSKGFTPVLLVIAILSSFLMPLSIMASFSDNGLLSALNDSGEEAATGSHIYAFLNYIDMSKTSNKQNYNLELVFKNENVRDANYYKGPYTDFADVDYVTTTYTFDSTGRPSKTWNYNQWSPINTAEANRLPWRNDSNNGDFIRKVTFKDKIAPQEHCGLVQQLKVSCQIREF